MMHACIPDCKKSGYIHTNCDLFVLHVRINCDIYDIVLQICIYRIQENKYNVILMVDWKFTVFCREVGFVVIYAFFVLIFLRPNMRLCLNRFFQLCTKYGTSGGHFSAYFRISLHYWTISGIASLWGGGGTIFLKLP